MEHLGSQIRSRIHAYKYFTPYLPETASWITIHKFRKEQIISIKKLLSTITVNDGCLWHDYMRDRKRPIITLRDLCMLLLIHDNPENNNNNFGISEESGFCWECLKIIITADNSTNMIHLRILQRAPTDNIPELNDFASEPLKYNIKYGCITIRDKEIIEDLTSNAGTPTSTVVSTIHDSDLDWSVSGSDYQDE